MNINQIPDIFNKNYEEDILFGSAKHLRNEINNIFKTESVKLNQLVRLSLLEYYNNYNNEIRSYILKFQNISFEIIIFKARTERILKNLYLISTFNISVYYNNEFHEESYLYENIFYRIHEYILII